MKCLFLLKKQKGERFAMENLKGKMGILVSFDRKTPKILIEPVEMGMAEVEYKELCSILGADLVDVAEYNNEIDIIVDDLGLQTSGNPVFEVQTSWGEYPLAGKLLFLKKELTSTGVTYIGLTAGEVLNLLADLQGKIKVIGVTN